MAKLVGLDRIGLEGQIVRMDSTRTQPFYYFAQKLRPQPNPNPELLCSEMGGWLGQRLRSNNP